MSQTRKGLRAAAGGVSTAKTTIFCCAVFTLNRQVKRDISLGSALIDGMRALRIECAVTLF